MCALKRCIIGACKKYDRSLWEPLVDLIWSPSRGVYLLKGERNFLPKSEAEVDAAHSGVQGSRTERRRSIGRRVVALLRRVLESVGTAVGQAMFVAQNGGDGWIRVADADAAWRMMYQKSSPGARNEQHGGQMLRRCRGSAPALPPALPRTYNPEYIGMKPPVLYEVEKLWAGVGGLRVNDRLLLSAVSQNRLSVIPEGGKSSEAGHPGGHGDVQVCLREVLCDRSLKVITFSE